MGKENDLNSILILIVLIVLGFISARLLHNSLNAIFNAYNLPEFSIGIYRSLVFGICLFPKGRARKLEKEG